MVSRGGGGRGGRGVGGGSKWAPPRFPPGELRLLPAAAAAAWLAARQTQRRLLTHRVNSRFVKGDYVLAALNFPTSLAALWGGRVGAGVGVGGG